MNHIVTHSGNIAKIYQTMKGKNKERFEYILEPLQAMVQLGILGYCPVGTKLCIQNNILLVQPPTIGQSIVRWFQNDGRTDILHLFNVFRRFVKFYKHLISDELFKCIINNARNGIEMLGNTYYNCDNVTLVHTLQLYKTQLDNIDAFDDIPRSVSNSECTIEPHTYITASNDSTPEEILTRRNQTRIIILSKKFNKNSVSEDTMEDVFKNISSIYDETYQAIILNLFNLANEEKLDYANLVLSYNTIFSKQHEVIQKWLNEHITL